MDKIAVLVPCYNEGITIGRVVKEWKEALPEAVVYVYDNNSLDNTAVRAKEAGAIVRTEEKQGKGNVVRRMFREIDAEVYIMVDGDNTYPASCGPDLVKAVLEDGADMVIGDRLSSNYLQENTRRFHNFGNLLVRNMINFCFRSDIRDVMTGCRAFSYEYVKTFPVISKGFEIETDMTIHALDKNMHLVNIPISYQERPIGSSSKLRTVEDGIKIIMDILRSFRSYRPRKFYGGLAGLCGIGAFLNCKRKNKKGAWILMVLGGAMALAGALGGRTAEMERRDFETKLIQASDRKRQLIDGKNLKKNSEKTTDNEKVTKSIDKMVDSNVSEKNAYKEAKSKNQLKNIINSEGRLFN